jgi:DNA-binding NarL/FixJ family response regulator/class 3 adenylate cyclase
VDGGRATTRAGRTWVEGGVDSQEMSRPTGTVTFLFTDVEDSTGLAQRLAERYPEALSQHRQSVRDAIWREGGYVVDCRGDEFFAVFEEAPAAVAAALSAQLASVEGWRTRMGIHTGIAILDEEDGYVGLEVHRAARICSAGHGGQILLSAAAREALDGDLHVRDLGEHALRGLPQPEQIFQLVADGLAADFPPLRSAGTLAKGATMRVVIAEDSVLLREGIAKLLVAEGFDVVGQSGTGDDLLLKVRSYKPDVAIVDIRMPPTHTDEGLQAAKEIREKHPQVGVLVLSQYVESGYALELLRESAEGVGYLLKDRVADVKEFADAVRRVGEGGSALDPTVVSRLVGSRRGEDPVETLTPREREVLELMAEGRSNQAIAEKIVVTPRAVEKHVTNIFTKLSLPPSAEDHRRVLAVLTYLNS